MANMLATLSIVLAVIQLSQQQQLDEGKWTQPEESWTWRTFNGCRYCIPTGFQVYRIRATFEEAEAHCSSKGAHLASIHSEEENILLMTITTTLSDVDDWAENTWIGLRQKDYPNSKEWTWTDGSPVDYVRWANMQPDNGSEKEHCVQVITLCKTNVHCYK
ncbi:lectin C-type domain protein [Cooperia oncophora]